jgi:hypothetical protein
MSGTPVTLAFPVITDPATGIGLNGGKVYIGVAGQDPEVNPVPVFWDANMTVPAAQPLRTLGGYIVNGSAPATAYVDVDYSMRVRDRFDSLISYSALAGRAGDLFDNLTITNTLTAGDVVVGDDLTVADDGVFGGDVTAQTPNVGTRGGFRLVANGTSGFGYVQVLASDGTTEWGNWRYASGGVARWSGALETGGALRVGGGASTVPVTVAAAATTTLDCRLSNVFRITMGTNVTSLVLSDPVDGQMLTLEFVQDATGSRTIAWPSSFRWPNNTASVLSTAANTTDVVSAIWNGLVWKVVFVRGYVP